MENSRTGVSEDVGNKVPSLLCRVMVLELCDVPMMLLVCAIVHSEEAEDQEGEGD